MAKAVVIKFKGNPKPYYFSAGKLELKKGQHVVVETSRGLDFGTVTEPESEVADEKIVPPLKTVIRIANERDEEIVKRNEARRGDAMSVCKEKIAEHKLSMKLIDCEFTFDGNKVIFTFTSESRVDFRELVKDLASYFHLRIELRQVGARDEAKILGGIAPCGRVCCCAGCMPELRKVSIKMAKNQGLSLNPGKIGGLCGRLMCCLAYEDEYYANACKRVPKIGATVSSPEGRGCVIATDMLKMTARLKIEKDGAVFYRDFPVSALGFKRGDREKGESREDPDDDKDVLPSDKNFGE